MAERLAVDSIEAGRLLSHLDNKLGWLDYREVGDPARSMVQAITPAGGVALGDNSSVYRARFQEGVIRRPFTA